MITAKKSKTGLSAIDTHVFKDGSGNPLPKGLQDQARVAVAELGMNNPDQFTYEVVNGVMGWCCCPKDEYTLAKEGIPKKLE